MKHDNFFAESILHVIASENIDITNDLNSTSDKSIAELLNEEEKKDDQTEKDPPAT